jgi:hypothetical protein
MLHQELSSVQTAYNIPNMDPERDLPVNAGKTQGAFGETRLPGLSKRG